MLRADSASGSHETGAQQAQHDFSRNSATTPQHGDFASVPDELALKRAGYRWLQVSAGWFGYSPGRETVGPLETRHAVTAWMWAHYRGETPQ